MLKAQHWTEGDKRVRLVYTFLSEHRFCVCLEPFVKFVRCEVVPAFTLLVASRNLGVLVYTIKLTRLTHGSWAR